MSIGHIPLDQIQAHPNNPRRHAVADEEMVDSIRAVGLMTAVTVAPAVEGAGYTMIGGHRRFDGATKAGLTEVPAVIREDLVTEAQQLEAMLVENLHRSDLTAVEEAEAYEQLVLQGMDADAIASATGRKASTVKARLKLNGLAETTRDRLHAGEMTLLDAEAMLEFADDPAATAELEQAIGTGNFQQRLYVIRDRRTREARKAELIAEYEAAGARLATSIPGTPGKVMVDGVEHRASGFHMFADEAQDPAAHPDCLVYVVPEWAYSDPTLHCINPSAHPAHPRYTSTPSPRVESDWEKERAEREERAARRAAASAARLDWLRDHFRGMFTARSASPLAAAAKAFLPTTLHDGRWPEVVDDTLLLAALDAVPGDEAAGLSYEAVADVKAAYAAGLSRAKPGKVLETFAAWLAALVADQLNQDMQWAEDDAEVLHHLGLWDWLKSAGYEFSDVDKEIVTTVEVRHTELANEAEAS